MMSDKPTSVPISISSTIGPRFFKICAIAVAGRQNVPGEQS